MESRNNQEKTIEIKTHFTSEQVMNRQYGVYGEALAHFGDGSIGVVVGHKTINSEADEGVKEAQSLGCIWFGDLDKQYKIGEELPIDDSSMLPKTRNIGLYFDNTESLDAVISAFNLLKTAMAAGGGAKDEHN